MVTDLNSACICVDMLLDVSNVQEDERLLFSHVGSASKPADKRRVCGSSGGRTSFDRVCRFFRSSCSSTCFQEFDRWFSTVFREKVDKNYRPRTPTPSLGHLRWCLPHHVPRQASLWWKSVATADGGTLPELPLPFGTMGGRSGPQFLVAENWMEQLSCKLYHR